MVRGEARTHAAAPRPAVLTLQALLKTGVGQVTLFPAYLSAFYLYMGVLEGLSPAQAVQKLRQAFVPTCECARCCWLVAVLRGAALSNKLETPAPAARADTAGWAFWPAANVFNFLVVPPTSRVLYANAVVSLGGHARGWQLLHMCALLPHLWLCPPATLPPPAQQGLFWNAILSWQNSSKGRIAAAAGTGAAGGGGKKAL